MRKPYCIKLNESEASYIEYQATHKGEAFSTWIRNKIMKKVRLYAMENNVSEDVAVKTLLNEKEG